MKNPIVWFVIILIAAGGGAFYFWKERSEREAQLEQLPPEKLFAMIEFWNVAVAEL